MERTIGLDKARGKLGQLAEEVRAENEPVVLMRRGEPLAVLVSPAEYERLTAADRRAAAEQLQARLIEVRNTVRKAGLDVAQARRLSGISKEGVGTMGSRKR